MAPKKPPQKPNVGLHPDASEALGKLQKALPEWGLPKETRRQEIASALAYYTSPLVAAAMTKEFLRHIGAEEDEAADDSGAEDDD
jgi:hypothetical protein